MTTLSGWLYYYLLTGAMAGQLIGLVFVALSVSTRLETNDLKEQRTWVVPIFIEFGAVVVVAMLFTVPRMSNAVLSLALCVLSALLLTYAIFVGLQLRRQHATRSRIGAADWLFGLLLPALSYASLFWGASLLLGSQDASLDVIAIAVGILLLVGIRNAWALAMWMLVNRRGA